MPPLWCRLDRLWFPQPGVLEGTMTKQPFLCPLDHVFEHLNQIRKVQDIGNVTCFSYGNCSLRIDVFHNGASALWRTIGPRIKNSGDFCANKNRIPCYKVNAMLRELPEEEFGPGINIREYSMLDNPSLPEEVKKSGLEVHLCQEGTHGCNVSNDSAVGGVLRIPSNSNEETFIKVFSSFKDVKVIQFSSMQNAFTGFADKGREDRFRRRVKRYVGIWCCVLDHIPGHIYYDMYWDEKPAWRPIPPPTSEDDHPPR